MNFQPEMTSTRLKSEEIYRECVTSDSLFTAQTRYSANPANTNNSNNQQQQQSRQEQQDSLSLLQDDVFENDDLFGPPPLPTKSDSKRAPKSKISQLFDDSDSGDELFSAASSGSRSQKSTDFLAAVSSSDKTTKALSKSGGLFDDNNIFGSKDVPDIDIFGAVSKSREASDDLFDSCGREQHLVTSKSSNIDNLQDTKMESKRISLFDDDGDDSDLFASARLTRPKSDRKADVLFEDEDDLFLSNKSSNKKHSSIEEGASVEPKIDVSKNTSSPETEKKNKDNSSDYMDGLFSKATKTRSLLFENDDYDDLFGKKDARLIHENDRSKPESKEEVKKDITEKVQELSEQNKDSESSSLNRDIKATTEIKNVIAKSDINEEKHKDEIRESSKTDEDGRTKKSSPPKTLSIRTSSPPSEEQNGQQVPRKSVSGKIKNLMGKMGDLKILSPMDAPPLWRKSEDKTDDDENIVDKDIGDQGIDGGISPPSVSEGSVYKEFSYSTTISTTSNVEVAINFDDLAQVETLSTTASKSRVRIQAKRRPQSRHARKSALRHSGIDFDTVDSADNDNSLDESHTNTSSSIKDLSAAPSINATDRLTANNVQRSTVDPSSTDDKSELGSISKESSMSVNKNTLLSPSTDEEDLFDVPPDLPEDPQREDTLFGRAPILSPIDDGQSDRTPIVVKSLIDTVIRKIDDIDIDTNNAVNNKSPKQDFSELTRSNVETKSDTLKDAKKDDKRSINEEQNGTTRESNEEPSDPLRDSSHDPLKDPSQLFAFVTKTPSPEKNKGLLFSESDDSLFSSGSAKKLSEPKKKLLDLFADDDAGGDLFSAAPLKKTVKKPLRDTKIGLFGDDDDDHNENDNLFGSISSKTKQDSQKSNSIQAGRKKNNIFDDDDDEDSSLFVESSGQSQKSDSTSFSESKHDLADSQAKNSNLKDIFGDMASSTFSCAGKIDNDDDDIDLFAARKVVPKKVKSLFASDDENDDDDAHIFGKQSSVSIDSKTNATTIAPNSKPVVKKSITRDLRKTAEKIVEDPLSLLQDD